MSNNSAEKNSEDPMPLDYENDLEGIVRIAWKTLSIYN